MGRDYNNGCYITGNFFQGVSNRYGDYFWEKMPCYQVISIIKFILKMLEEDGYYPLTAHDVVVKAIVRGDWYWGHADAILEGDSSLKNIIEGRYFYVAYAEILSSFLNEALTCNSTHCKCWFESMGSDSDSDTEILYLMHNLTLDDQLKNFDKAWEKLHRIKAARVLQKVLYREYICPRLLKHK